MSACPIHGYRGVVFACEHIAGRRADIDPPINSTRIDTGSPAPANIHHWCESCVQHYALSPASDSEAGYPKLAKKLRPVCSACLEWLTT